MSVSTTDDSNKKGENYLDNGGSCLREAIAANPEVQRKLTDALAIFDDCEKKMKEFLSTVL
jgi:transaldolase